MCRLELAIIDYYYLSVRTTHIRTVRDYVIDLRFTEDRLRASRHVPQRWILVALALAGIAAIAIRQALSSTSPWWQQHSLVLCAATIGLATCAGLACAWRMTETLSLRSLHGGAALFEYTGGLGTLRSSRQFARKLAAHIQLAVADRRATIAAHLRDEMREHFRLKESGVLSREQYEVSKAQILAQHARAPRATSRAVPCV